MEGETKEIVLQRLEQRLKDKDEEIRALKREAEDNEASKSLKERVDTLENEVRQIEITLTEVLKMISALDVSLNTALTAMADNTRRSMSEQDLSVPGSMPMDPQMFDDFAADANQKDIKEDGHNDKDVTRFFHLGQNS